MLLLHSNRRAIMKENDVITDGTAKFIVKKIGGGV